MNAILALRKIDAHMHVNGAGFNWGFSDDAILRATDRLISYPSHAARALRMAGELLEASDPHLTQEYWERALALDAKVGIAKRLKELRRLHGRG